MLTVSHSASVSTSVRVSGSLECFSGVVASLGLLVCSLYSWTFIFRED